MAKSPARKRFKYDVAFSFAGENRASAKRLKIALSRQCKENVRIFYDDDYQSHLWGKNQQEFERIYGPESRYVVPLVSEHYVRKDWTMFEYDVAKEEATKRDCEFILPIRIDNTRLLGFSRDTCYLDLRKESIARIANSLIHKLYPNRDKARKPLSKPKRSAVVLNNEQRHMLGLIAVSKYPLVASHYQRLFPNYKWDKCIAKLRKQGLLKQGTKYLTVSRRVERALLCDPEEAKGFRQAWLRALAPHEGAPDIEIMRALILLEEDPEHAVCIIADAALCIQSGLWNDTYHHILKNIFDHRSEFGLSNETRIRLYNSYGVCCARAGDYHLAVELFGKLRRYSHRVDDQWGIGKSYINGGVAWHYWGNDKEAERFYRKAIDHARKSQDRILLARALNNLASIVLDSDHAGAHEMLEESMAIKNAEKDEEGIFAAWLTLGNLSSTKGDHKEALSYYKRAEKTADKLGHLQGLCLARVNIATSQKNLKNTDDALKNYRKAFHMAKDESFLDSQILALEGEAVLREELGHFGTAAKCFRQLHHLRAAIQDEKGMIIALHDAGLCLIHGRRQIREARRMVKRALQLASKKRDAEWIFRCHLLYGLSYHYEGNRAQALRVLANAPHDLALHHSFIAQLLRTCGDISRESGSERALQYYSQAANVLVRKRRKTYRDYWSLAELGELSGDERMLGKYLSKAKSGAMKHSDHHVLKTSCIALAELYCSQSTWGQALKELEIVLRLDIEVEEKLQLLLFQFYVALHQGDDKLAESIFKEARRLSIKCDHNAQYIELHMMFGDYYWDKGKRSQYTALKAYISGLAMAFSRVDAQPSEFIEHGLYIAKRLHSQPNGCRRIEELRHRIDKWMRKEIRSSPHRQVVNMLQWPFKVALETSKWESGGRRITQNRLQEIVESAISSH